MMVLAATIVGTVWKLGDHVNTDILHPPSHFSLDERRIQEGLQEGMDRLKRDLTGDFVSDGLVIVAGENFGCGSSRETSVRSLCLCGVRAVVARSFARIFYRSLTNRGIPPVKCNGIQEWVKDGNHVYISFTDGFIELGEEKRFTFPPFDPHIERILECGGLVPYLKEESEWGMTTM